MTELTHRYKIWLRLEAETPLSIGSGREGLTTDRLIACNGAGFPYIPGTGLAGALRAALEIANPIVNWDAIWGDKTRKTDKGTEKDFTRGSRLMVNSAHLLAEDGNIVLEGLCQVVNEQEYYKQLRSLPERDHVSINHRGASTNTGKFDEQLCYKGVRFIGSLELMGTEKDADEWHMIINELASPFFRIGGGTRKGFGKIKVKHQYTRVYDLQNVADRTAYLKTDNSLQLPTDAMWELLNFTAPLQEKYDCYELTLTPRDFFFFGAGFGDDEADDVYKCEKIIEWSSGYAEVSDQQILIPASSVKGTLRHRLAFYYNRLTGATACLEEQATSLLPEKLRALEKMAVVPEEESSDSNLWSDAIKKLEEATFEPEQNTPGKEEDRTAQNLAVKTLFGYAADHKAEKEEKGQRGNVLFSDVFIKKDKKMDKVFDHVRIDRFTGGASDGALFQEKTVYTKEPIKLELYVAKDALKEPAIKKAWHDTLNDLCEGLLPLGGKTTKGHGFFTGKCNIDLK